MLEREVPLRGSAEVGPTGRHYRDSDGVRWCVREVQSVRRPPALYFESDASFRRVTRYPRNWQALSGTDLEILSHGK